MTDTYVLKAYLWKRNDAKVSGVFLAMSLRVFFFCTILIFWRGNIYDENVLYLRFASIKHGKIEMGKIGHQFMVNSKYIDVHCSILPISLFKIFYNKNIFEKKK